MALKGEIMTEENLKKGKTRHRTRKSGNSEEPHNALKKSNEKRKKTETKKEEGGLIKATRNLPKGINRRKQQISKNGTIKIIPLGGLHEVGKNITVIEYESEIIVIDCGMTFPGDDMLGVDLVIPDVTYLVRNKEKIKGMIITHGHEDHIGAIPYVLKQINIPIYATRLTAGLIKNKLDEHRLTKSTEMHIVKAGEEIKLGSFKIEFIQSSHSIPDSVMLAIKTTILEYNSIDTIIFDEIDTGVSGKVATKIGEKMKKTALKKQVICITHLPQVAALADYHYCIEKKSTDDETITSIHLLDSNQKIIEIAKERSLSENGNSKFEFINANSMNVNIEEILRKNNIEKVQFVIFHPPYWDIIKFNDLEGNLANAKTLEEFLDMFTEVEDNMLKYLEKRQGYKYKIIKTSYICTEIKQKDILINY